ncbi:MAG: 50S ribosomal protein L30 [Acidobacteria bacterium]|nr:MAG: 50S ribosomal protein L30 [Acidobacteriota bacterium]
MSDEKPEATKKTVKKKRTSKKSILKLKLVKSLIGSTKRQRETVKGLGLRKIRDTVELQDTPEIRGMVKKVLHLLEVEKS